MRINRQAFCQTLFREFGVSVTPSDLPVEVIELLDCVDYELGNVKRYEGLICEWQECISQDTFEYITIDEDYEEGLNDLASLFRNLLAKGYTTGQIDKLVEDAKGEI